MKKYLSTLCYLKTNILVLQTLKKSRFYLSQFNSTRSRLPYFVSLLLFDFLVKFCDKLEILRKIPLSRLAVKSLAKAYDAQVFTWLRFDAQLHWSRFRDKCNGITYDPFQNCVLVRDIKFIASNLLGILYKLFAVKWFWIPAISEGLLVDDIWVFRFSRLYDVLT